MYLAVLATATDLYGKPTEGVVVGHREEDDGEGTSYKLTVRYYANNQIYSRSLSVNRKVYHSIKDGAQVNLQYLPEQPRFAKFHDRNINEHSTLVYWVFGIFWNACVLLTVFGLGQMPRKHYRLIRNGIVTEGAITNKTSKDIDGSTEYQIQYKYFVNGAPVFDDLNVSSKDFPRISVGQNITVFYTPGKPTENLIYDFSYLESGQSEFLL